MFIMHQTEENGLKQGGDDLDLSNKKNHLNFPLQETTTKKSVVCPIYPGTDSV
jgi:hypothetical protein